MAGNSGNINDREFNNSQNGIGNIEDSIQDVKNLVQEVEKLTSLSDIELNVDFHTGGLDTLARKLATLAQTAQKEGNSISKGLSNLFNTGTLSIEAGLNKIQKRLSSLHSDIPSDIISKEHLKRFENYSDAIFTVEARISKMFSEGNTDATKQGLEKLISDLEFFTRRSQDFQKSLLESAGENKEELSRLLVIRNITKQVDLIDELSKEYSSLSSEMKSLSDAEKEGAILSRMYIKERLDSIAKELEGRKNLIDYNKGPSNTAPLYDDQATKIKENLKELKLPASLLEGIEDLLENAENVEDILPKLTSGFESLYKKIERKGGGTGKNFFKVLREELKNMQFLEPLIEKIKEELFTVSRRKKFVKNIPSLITALNSKTTPEGGETTKQSTSQSQLSFEEEYKKILQENVRLGKIRKEDAEDLYKKTLNARKEVELANESNFKTSSYLYNQLLSITEEIKTQAAYRREGKQALERLTNIARQLRDHEEGSNELGEKKLKNLGKEAELRGQIARRAAGNILQDIKFQEKLEDLTRIRAELTADENLSLESRDNLYNELENILKESGATEQEKAIIFAAYGEELGRIVLKAKELAQTEELIQKRLGLAGTSVKALEGFLKKIGISGGAFSEGIQDANEKMRELAKESVKWEKGLEGGGRYVSRFEILGRGLGIALKGAAKQMFSIEIIAGFLLKTLFDVNKQSVELKRLTGQTGLNLKYFHTSAADSIDVLKTLTSLTSQFGYNAQNAFTEEVIGQAADLTVEMGLSVEQAGKFALYAQTSGKQIKDLSKGVVATVNNYNRVNKTAVSHGIIMRDVANTSEDIALSLGNSTESISAAASGARRLGMDLKRVDDIASSLLDFESSIGNELEAQLLTGNALNLTKAREYALNNDLVGLGKELFENSTDIHKFGRMNRIQQESYAKALGMSRQELARIAYQRAIDQKMSKAQAAAAADVNLEEMKRLDIQENFQKALMKVASAITPLLEDIGDILSNKWTRNIAAAVVGLGVLGSVGLQIFKVFKSIGSLFGGFGIFGKKQLFFENLIAKIKDKQLKTTISQIGAENTLTATVTERAAAERLANASGNEIPSAGVEKFTESLVEKFTESFAKNSTSILKAAAAVTLLAGSLFVFAKALQVVDGLENGLADLGILAGGLIALSVAARIVAPALIGLGTATANPTVWAGIAVIAALAASAIGLGFALKLATPAIEAIGNVIGKTFAGISTTIKSATEGISKLVSTVTLDKVFALTSLAIALMEVSAGLSAVALSGILALPVLVALTAFAATSPTIKSSTRTPNPELEVGNSKTSREEKTLSESSKIDISKLEAKLDKIITVLQEGKNIRIDMDGNKVGKSLAIAAVRSS